VDQKLSESLFEQNGFMNIVICTKDFWQRDYSRPFLV